MSFPLSLAETSLADWSQIIVPDGKHKGKTFQQVVDCGSASWYRCRQCSSLSLWGQSLKEYVNAVESKDKDRDADMSKDKDCGADGNKFKNKNKWQQDDEDEGEWLEVKAPDNKKEKAEELTTLVLRLPPGSSVTVNMK